MRQITSQHNDKKYTFFSYQIFLYMYVYIFNTYTAAVVGFVYPPASLVLVPPTHTGRKSPLPTTTTGLQPPHAFVLQSPPPYRFLPPLHLRMECVI